MNYNQNVEALFFNLNHVGVLECAMPRTIHYRCGESGRGDVIDFYVSWDNTGKVLRACFKAFGSPFTLAAAEWTCQQLEKNPLKQHPLFNYSTLIDYFSIPSTRYAIALQVEDGYKEIIRLMKVKQEEEHCE